MSCRVRVGPAVENAELLSSGIIDRKSARDLDDPPRCWNAVDHSTDLLATPPDRKARRTSSCTRPSNHTLASHSWPVITDSRASDLFNDRGRRLEGDRRLTDAARLSI